MNVSTLREIFGIDLDRRTNNHELSLGMRVGDTGDQFIIHAFIDDAEET